MDDREKRIVSDMNTSYLSTEALEDIQRLGLKLAEGEPLSVSDYDEQTTKEIPPGWSFKASLVSTRSGAHGESSTRWTMSAGNRGKPDVRNRLGQCSGIFPERGVDLGEPSRSWLLKKTLCRSLSIDSRWVFLPIRLKTCTDAATAFGRAIACLTRDHDAAIEVVQEAFARAVARREQFRGDGPLEAWIWKIAIRTAL